MFDKSDSLFPVTRDHIDLATCSIGPMYGPAATAAQAFVQEQSERGMLLRDSYGQALTGFRERVAELLRVRPDDVAYVSNTAEGIGLIANGYPFEPGDQVIGYIHEFPSNHYPWLLQEKRGVELVLLADVDAGSNMGDGRPRGWSMEELDRKTTDRTRVIALSHVQFVSGYAADLRELGDYCRAPDIDLIVDAAQSLGVLPIYPEECGVAAVVSAAWKWLLASRGAGLAYLSQDLRRKLRLTMAGDGMMKHRLEYLNHEWNPLDGARAFEYSTLPWEHLVAIETVVGEVFLRYGMESIRDEVFRLQDVLLAALDNERVRPLVFSGQHRSGILALDTDRDPEDVVRELKGEGIVVTSQGGFLRLAGHFFLTDEDMRIVAAALNRIA